MSRNLCLNCGEIKFGAICKCPKCGIVSCGIVEYDILFSDVNFSQKELEDFSYVIQNLNTWVENKELIPAYFIKFISDEYPEILGI